MSKVRLAIRVRPFTERELKSETAREPVVRVEDQHTLSITNLKVASSGAGDSRLRVRRYYADYCLDSACAADDPSYASQEKVYATVGQEVLDTVLGGQSACVLAYGQSATGKTHSMLGTAAEPGLVPRLCRELAALAHERRLTVSFLEIYNERVRDLLCVDESLQTCPGGLAGYNSLPRRRGNASKDLRVREHPTRGPYVQNLRRVVVHDPDQLCALVWAGVERRRAAATRRNPLSSRSHALLQLTAGAATLHLADLAGRCRRAAATRRNPLSSRSHELLQLTAGAATLHLADLAGSEKAGAEGGYCCRQKEGANINKSLVALSNVISALVCAGAAGGGAGRTRGRYVPYRDSALTWLLKDCFTGGAATFILATVSASSACYSESASTLRWAARARQLPAARAPAHARLPAAPADPAHRLQRQLSALLAALLNNHIRYIPETGVLEHDINYWTLKKVESLENCPSNGAQVLTLEMSSLNDSKSLDTNHYGSNESSVTSTSSDRHEDKELIECKTSADFSQVLERTVSGHDLKVAGTRRNQRRQYRSHEVLPTGLKLVISSSKETSSLNASNTGISTSTEENASIEVVSLQSDEHDQTNLLKAHVPYEIENPRAEIVASVTDRLYTKLKKKENSSTSKVEKVTDKKIMEPLHELKICTNARQRLVEMSQRATRMRKKIGVAVHTQTRASVTRVKDQPIGAQTDLQPQCNHYNNTHKHYIDVCTETEPLTSRCREAAVGPATGSLYRQDSSTLTEIHSAPNKSCSVMTDGISKSNVSTQTSEFSPQRFRSAFTKYLAPHNSNAVNLSNEETSTRSIINISISQAYPYDSDSLSDDSLEMSTCNATSSKPNLPPDLLSNHNSVDQEIQVNPVIVSERDKIISKTELHSLPKFPITRVNTKTEQKYAKEVEFSLDDQNVNQNMTVEVEKSRKKSADCFSQSFPCEILLVSVGTQTLHANNLHVEGERIFSELANPNQFSKSCSTSGTLSKICEHRTAAQSAKLLANGSRCEIITPNIKNRSLYNTICKSPSLSCEIMPSNQYARFLFNENDLPCSEPVNEDEQTSKQTNDKSDSEFEFNYKHRLFEVKNRRRLEPWFRHRKVFNCCPGDAVNEINKYCMGLERSIEVYEEYIRRLEHRHLQSDVFGSSTSTIPPLGRSPSGYLQNLIQERRRVVKETKQNFGQFNSIENFF